MSANEGRCCICGEIPELNKHKHIDHCHETGAIRGMLCRSCNLGLGFFKDCPDLLRNAIIYLTKGDKDDCHDRSRSGTDATT